MTDDAPVLAPSIAPGPSAMGSSHDVPPCDAPVMSGSDQQPGFTGEFDHVWGLTSDHANVESAAVRRTEDDDAPPGLLDLIPGISADAPPRPPDRHAGLEDDALHDGHTVSIAHWGRPATAAGAPSADPPAGGRPRVRAIHCPAGHPNPPVSQTCRDCGAPVPYSEPVSIPRPTLGVLRFSTGQVIPLDQPCLIGRNPTVSRLSGAEIPVIVRIESTGRDLSRNHAEVRLEEWHVLLVDLGSRNGTTATVPGRPAVTLDPRRAFHLLPGTVVTLSDDVTFVYEVTR